MDADENTGWTDVLAEGEGEVGLPGAGWGELLDQDQGASSQGSSGGGFEAILQEAMEEDENADGWAGVLEEGEADEGVDDDDGVNIDHGPSATPGTSAGGELVEVDMVGGEHPPTDAAALLADVRAQLGGNAAQAGDLVLGQCLVRVAGLEESTKLRGKRLFDEASLVVAKKLSADSHLRSATAMATDTGTDFRKVVAVRFRIGAAAMTCGREVAGRLVHTLTENTMNAGGECLLLTTRFRYDETPLRLTTVTREQIVDEGVPLGALTLDHLLAKSMVAEENSPTAKLVQVEIQGSMLLKLGTRFHFVSFAIPSSLACVDRCTGRVYFEVLNQSAPKFAALEGRFHRTQRLSTTDGDNACALAERASAVVAPQRGHCHLFCDLHRGALVAKKIYRLMPFEMTGIINISLSLKAPGGMRKFRKILRRVLSDRLVVLHGSPGPQADRHREAVLDMYVTVDQQRPSSLSKRLIISRLANGNYENTREVEHYCSGCCSSRHDTVLKLCSVYTRAIAGMRKRCTMRWDWGSLQPAPLAFWMQGCVSIACLGPRA